MDDMEVSVNKNNEHIGLIVSGTHEVEKNAISRKQNYLAQYSLQNVC